MRRIDVLRHSMRELLEQEMEKDEVFEEVENDIDFQEQKRECRLARALLLKTSD